MNNNELSKHADYILNIIFHIKNKDKNREELINLIKPRVMEIHEDGRKLGRTQILNHIEGAIDELRK